MRKRIFLMVCVLLLCLTATHAWIIQQNEQFVESFSINYQNGTLIISDKKVKASLWIKPDEEGAKPIEISNSDKADGEQYLVDNVVPGKSVNFILKLQNTSASEVPISISIGRLVCDQTLIGTQENPKVSVELSDVTLNNYPIAKNPGPKSYMLTEESMVHLTGDAYTINLYDGLYVPPTGDEWIEIQGRLVFSSELDNTYQNKTFRLDSIKIVE